jgi:hypothetical protein
MIPKTAIATFFMARELDELLREATLVKVEYDKLSKTFRFLFAGDTKMHIVFSFSPVKYDLTGVQPPPTPGDPSGSFLGIGGTVYYRLVLSGMNEGKKTGFALEPLAGVMFESLSVTAQTPALVLSSSAIVPHFGARGVFRVIDSLELLLDARFRLPLGTSESPNKTGDPGLGIGLSIGGGAHLWLTSFLGLGVYAAYEYASVSFSGTGDRQRFMDDPPLVNASVATSALKVNVSALLAF